MGNLMIIVAGIMIITLWIWAIIDITLLRRKYPQSMAIIFWIAFFFPLFGSLLYFLFKKRIVRIRNREFNPQFNN